MKEMEELTSCKTAIDNCKTSGTFAIAHLYKEEKAMDMHIHDCYEIYYSICAATVLIDNCSTPSPQAISLSSTSTKVTS